MRTSAEAIWDIRVGRGMWRNASNVSPFFEIFEDSQCISWYGIWNR